MTRRETGPGGSDVGASVPHAYGSLARPSGRGGVVAAVDPGSPAAAAGIEPGDLMLTADGLALRDVIDWQWIADGDEVTLVAERAPARVQVTISRGPGEPWGIAFTTPVFDRVRTCANDCSFCFVSQLPDGLRDSLYLRDDDYRLSFLAGTFITLTNLTDADVTRIIEQRLSPLHVSLHAVSPQVRALLVGCHGEDRALERIEELVAAGIELHVQIVLVPRVNDGEELVRTLGWLAARGESVASVGLVPLGYTAHQDRFEASYEEPAEARSVIEAVRPWQEAALDRRGLVWVQAADELYVAARMPVPPADAYDGYPQYENGIGMVRAFVDDFTEAAASREAGSSTASKALDPAVLVSGELFAPVLEGLLRGLGPVAAEVSVLPVRNRFLGGNVNVAGLLTARDLVEAVAADAQRARLRGEEPGPYLVPDLVLNDDRVTLDDVPGSELGARAGTAVRVVSSDAATLLDELGEASADVSAAGTQGA